MEVWTSLASVLGVVAFCQSLMHTIFPPELRFLLTKFFNRFFLWFSSYCYFEITEVDGVNTNELYTAVQLYLSSSVSVIGSRLTLTRSVNSTAITFGLPSNGAGLIDTFNGVTAWWEHVVTQKQTQSFSWRPLPEEKRMFTLRINKKNKPIILNSYLDFIMERANEIRRKNQDRQLYTNSRHGYLDSRGFPWESVPFKHPSTFDTLAMDPNLKSQIMNDLRDFSEGKLFYQKTGRSWKRGYLLYGPPGTGKSSMIAAMANFMGYDIYDLELTEVHTNSELRKLLMKTTPKSIIVIEDIDCSINLSSRNIRKPVVKSDSYLDMRDESSSTSLTLSGLLNFTDGLWSCCGSERIFVFTTNHIEKLDPALLRSGRMDLHIHMSFCSFPALKILMKNYLGVQFSEDLHVELLKTVESLIDKAEMTPADISEILIKNRRDHINALDDLLKTMKNKIEKRWLSGDLRGKSPAEEEEEQEKRALESPHKRSDLFQRKCENEFDEREKTEK